MSIRAAVKTRALGLLLKICLTVVFVLLVNRTVPADELSMVGSHISAVHVVVALLVGIVGIALHVKRWEIILRYQGFSVGRWDPLKTMLWGTLLAFVTPGRLGELFRGLGLMKDRRTDSIFAVVIDKVYIVTTTLMIGVLCLALQAWGMGVSLPARGGQFLCGAVLLCGGGIALLTVGSCHERARHVVQRLGKIVRASPRLFAPAGQRALLFSLAAHCSLLAQTAILFDMFGYSVSIHLFVAMAEAYALMAILPFFIGNMGIREYSYALFLGQFSSSVSGAAPLSAASLGVSVTILALNLVLPALVGLLWYLFDVGREQTAPPG